MDLNINLGLTCIFTAEVINEAGEVTFSTGPFHNTILDVGLLSLNTTTIEDMATWVNVGTGSNPPDVSQTGLQTRLYSCNTIFNAQEGAYYNYFPTYQGYKRVIQFPIGTVTGLFTEVGLSLGNNVNYLNRQLFKNQFGKTIAVRVLADEGLRITCDLRLYPAPGTKVYSEAYSVNLKGATAGTITFTNGTTSRTLSYAELTTSTTGKLAFENLLGVGTVTNYVLENEVYKLLCHPLNVASMNLSISSHTLTGGTDAPTLTVLQPYTNTIKTSNFTLEDIVSGTEKYNYPNWIPVTAGYLVKTEIIMISNRADNQLYPHTVYFYSTGDAQAAAYLPEWQARNGLSGTDTIGHWNAQSHAVVPGDPTQDTYYAFYDTDPPPPPAPIIKSMQTYWALQVAGMNLLTMKLAAVSGVNYSGWFTSGGISPMSCIFGNILGKAITQAGTLPNPTFVSSLTTPTVGDFGFSKRVYYASAILGAGTQTVVGFTLYLNDSDTLPAIAIIKLDTPISITAAEEFEFNIKFSWGRYIS